MFKKMFFGRVATTLCVALLSSGVDASTIPTTEDWARKDLYKNPDEMNESIVAEWSGGEWSNGSMTGLFRFVVATPNRKAAETYSRCQQSQGSNSAEIEGCAELYLFESHLYVQWYREADDVLELAYSIGIRELNEFSSYSISMPVCLGRCETATVTASSIFEHTKHSFELDLSVLGEYKLTVL